MMLIAAFGASIGGIGTPIGTPPNLIGIGMLNRIAGVNISFFQWMLLGVPIVVLLFGFLVAYFYFRSLRGLTLDTSRTSHIEEELRRLGPVSRGQRNVLVAFGLTVALWLLPGVLAIVGAGDSAFAQGFCVGGPGVGGGDIGSDPAVRAAHRLARAAIHADVGGGGPHRLGDHPAVRRRAQHG